MSNEGEFQSRQPNVEVNDQHVTPCYANFCRVASTPEEVILDLGMNPHPYTSSQQPIEISQRVVLSHYTAKRLLTALAGALRRHEEMFGAVETDIRKRVQPGNGKKPTGPN